MPVSPSDLVCFSHLRWDGVFQRPHHLMSRAAEDRRVFYVEEPRTSWRPSLELATRNGVTVVTPTIPRIPGAGLRAEMLRGLLEGFVAREAIDRAILWYYAPPMISWTPEVEAHAVVYDAMDELAAFRNAPAETAAREADLIEQADVVFTGGRSLYAAKRLLHRHVHAFPSSVDVEHFRRARSRLVEPPDQASLPHPRIGWFGVIDERLDLPLLAQLARRRPDWSIVLIGPVAKIDPRSIPAAPNIHRLGQRPYESLPSYLTGWDVAIMPFARNAATRFISPTKTPEYLAGGRPVVSTSIADVVRPYGERGLVRIADEPEAFVAACEAAIVDDPVRRLAAVDAFLAGMSWDRTWDEMEALVEGAAQRRAFRREPLPTPLEVQPLGLVPERASVIAETGRSGRTQP